MRDSLIKDQFATLRSQEMRVPEFDKLVESLMLMIIRKGSPPIPLTTITVNKYAKKLFPTRESPQKGSLRPTDCGWIGTFPQDKIPLNKIGFAVINVDTADKPGSHWCALKITKTRIYVYDSFGRKSSDLLPVLTRNAKARGMRIIDAEYDREQSNAKGSVVCGHLSLAWLLTVKKHGITMALKV